MIKNIFIVIGNWNIKKFIITEIKQKDESIEILSLYESEILENDENFYNFVYSGSLFGNKKIITIFVTK